MEKYVLTPVAVLCLVMLSMIPDRAWSSGTETLSEQEACLLRVLREAPDQLTIGEARSRCSTSMAEAVAADSGEEGAQRTGVVEKRLEVDKSNILKPFTLMSHRNNYILAAAHNFQGWDSEQYEEFYGVDSIDVDDTEVQFQLSIKTPLAVNLFDEQIDIFAAYTVRSFWQLYNNDNSSPFRETNHEPEIWLQVRPPDWEVLGFSNTVSLVGFNHMSNGQGGELSRSWNRIFAAFAFERDNFAVLLRPWIRVREDADEDDNPDITDYYGHGELWLAYKHDEHTFSLMTRNNLESGFSRGAVELGWSFPLFHYPFLKGYIQYFSGYGESLIDYNRYVNRIGIGLQLTDML